MSIVFAGLATAAFAQTVKLDRVARFDSPGDDANGLPNEVAQGQDGALYAVSTFTPSTSLAFFRINPVTHGHSVAATLDVGQTFPSASRLVLAGDGRFYTSFLGAEGGGILSFDPATNSASVVRQFLADPATGGPGVDGMFPNALTLGRDGWLYGTMSASSPEFDEAQSGSIFKLNPVTGTFVTLRRFQQDAGGAFPYAPLAQGADGTWYGLNLNVDSFCGQAFKFDALTTAVTQLYAFNDSSEGCGPSSLAVLPSGLLIGVHFGSTVNPLDGTTTTGTVFTLDPATKVLSPLHVFFASDPYTPTQPGNVTVTPGGNAYVLAQNLSTGLASILRVHPDTGAMENIQDLAGSVPEIGALTIGSDARLYGIFDSFDVFALGVLDPVLVFPAGGVPGGTATLSASLNALGLPLAGRRIAFTVNNVPVGSALTDLAGVATLDNVSLAGVPSGTFPNAIGASFAGDALFPASAGSGLLNVLELVTPGLMVGDGYVAEGLLRYDFTFVVQEKANGTDRGKLELRIKDVDDGRKKKVVRNDRFISTSYTNVVFSFDTALRPQFDDVAFAGTGIWNGVAGYRFEALAQDHLGPGKHKESFKIVIYNPANQIVASVDGVVKGGKLEARRIHHR